MPVEVAMLPEQISFSFAMAGVASGLVVWLIFSRF